MNLSIRQLQALVQAATLAPSSHNTQPWLFRLERQVIELLADRTRALPVNDPDDRELTISCGCALLNLRVAAAASLAVLDTADKRLGAAALVAEGDAMLWANPSWRRELAAWMLDDDLAVPRYRPVLAKWAILFTIRPRSVMSVHPARASYGSG